MSHSLIDLASHMALLVCQSLKNHLGDMAGHCWHTLQFWRPFLSLTPYHCTHWAIVLLLEQKVETLQSLPVC